MRFPLMLTIVSEYIKSVFIASDVEGDASRELKNRQVEVEDDEDIKFLALARAAQPKETRAPAGKPCMIAEDTNMTM